MSNGNDKQQPPPSQGPIKVKALYFLALEGVMCRALRSCDGKMHELQAGQHPRKPWTVEIMREPWHRMFRVTETEEHPDGAWPKVRSVLIPESAASYVPEVP